MKDKYYLTDEWKSLRLRVLERDDFTCQNCGRRQGPDDSYRKSIRLTAHHVISRSQGGKDAEENLTTLCSSCHSSRPQSKETRQRVSQAIKALYKAGRYNYGGTP